MTYQYEKSQSFCNKVEKYKEKSLAFSTMDKSANILTFVIQWGKGILSQNNVHVCEPNYYFMIINQAPFGCIVSVNYTDESRKG